MDITKGLAPIFVNTNVKSSEAGNVASKDNHSSSQEFDANAYERSQSLTKRNATGYGRGNDRGRSSGNRDRLQNRTSTRLRSVGLKEKPKIDLVNKVSIVPKSSEKSSIGVSRKLTTEKIQAKITGKARTYADMVRTGK